MRVTERGRCERLELGDRAVHVARRRGTLVALLPPFASIVLLLPLVTLLFGASRVGAALEWLALAVLSAGPFVAASPRRRGAGGARWSRRSMRFHGDVRIDEAGVHLDDILVLPRAIVLDAGFAPRGGGGYTVTVVARGAWERTRFAVDDEKAARRVLRALAVGPRRSVRRYVLSWHRLRARSVATALALGPLVAGVTLGALGGAWDDAAAVIVAAYAAVALTLVANRSDVEIGPDGFVLRRPWARRFVPVTEIAALEPWPTRGKAGAEGFDVRLHDGETLPMRTAAARDHDGSDPVLRRLRALLSRAHEPRVAPARVLPAPRASMAEWVAALRRLGAGADASHRNATYPPESLIEILESPSAEPMERAGAAVALSSLEETAVEPRWARARIARVSACVASPELRRALGAVAEHPDDDDDVTAALASLARSSGG